ERRGPGDRPAPRSAGGDDEADVRRAHAARGRDRGGRLEAGRGDGGRGREAGGDPHRRGRASGGDPPGGGLLARALEDLRGRQDGRREHDEPAVPRGAQADRQLAGDEARRPDGADRLALQGHRARRVVVRRARREDTLTRDILAPAGVAKLVIRAWLKTRCPHGGVRVRVPPPAPTWGKRPVSPTGPL